MRKKLAAALAALLLLTLTACGGAPAAEPALNTPDSTTDAQPAEAPADTAPPQTEAPAVGETKLHDCGEGLTLTIPNVDVSSGAVDWAVEAGVTNGTGAQTFSPSATCTRGQIVTFLYRAFAK